MAAETKDGFTIEGKVYSIVPMQEWDMDESQILYEYTGLGLEDLAINPDISDEEQYQEVIGYLKNPGFVRTLMHIAYRRANPKATPEKIKKTIGTVNAMQAITEFIQATGEEDEVRPPELTTEPSEQSGNGSVVQSESSGQDSTTDSDVPEDHLESTGTSRSDTSSLLSTQGTWGS